MRELCVIPVDTLVALTAKASVNTTWYHVAAGGEMAPKGLKIRCPKGRAGSTPALGTSMKF